ncbi:MAG: ABC transporter permease [Clostridiales Family XIII bacterium]|jgi:ribose transport system permease protein|nr:ABC transporter permease [Clostridiales Family XIII bacterium]
MVLKPKTIRKLITIGLVIAMALLFGMSTESFFTVRNITMIFRDASYVGIIALGVSFVVIGGGIDLSANGIVCFVGMACARLGVLAGFPAPVIVIVGLLAGALCGYLNGLAVTRLHLSEFITTLASGYIFAGFAVFLVFRENGNVASAAVTNKAFLALGGHIPHTYIYISSVVWVLLAIVVYIIQTKTKFGLHTVALGSNPKSTMMSGVDIDFLKLIGFVLAGLFCGIAGIFQVAYQSASTLTLGDSMGFQAVAVCAVGGVVLGGGKGDAMGAFLGALFMVILLNGLYKISPSPSIQFIFQGLIILVAIFFDTWFNRMMEKKLFSDAVRKRKNQTPLGAVKAEG